MDAIQRLQAGLGCAILAVSTGGLAAHALGRSWPYGVQTAVSIAAVAILWAWTGRRTESDASRRRD